MIFKIVFDLCRFFFRLISYGHWNGYSYNHQGNPTAYQYPGSDPNAVQNPASSTAYTQYSQHQSNSAYPYGPSNPNEYYSHYGYGAPQHGTSNVYADPNGELNIFFSKKKLNKSFF